MTLCSLTTATTLAEAARIYLEWLDVRVAAGRLSPSTRTNRRNGLAKLGPLGEISLGALRRSQVIAWVDALSTSPQRSADFTCLKALQVLLRWCADRDAASIDVARRVRYEYQPPPGRALTYPELKALRVVLSRSTRLEAQLIRVIADTGARTCEVRLARDEHYDAAAGAIRWPSGKSGKPRVVVLSRTADLIIRSRVRRDPSRLLFPGERSGQPFSHPHLNRMLQRFCADAGIPEPGGFTMHNLRDTFATLAYELGSESLHPVTGERQAVVSLTDVSRGLGHDNTRQTVVAYLQNIVDPGARRAMRAVNPEEVA